MRSFFIGGIALSLVAAQTLAAGSLDVIQNQLGIPLSEGRVIEASGRKPQVYLIQDIHKHPEAQQHIRSIILTLKRGGAGDVFLEGAWSEGAMPDFHYQGLEDPDLYKANVAAYQAVSDVREPALREIETSELLDNALDTGSGRPWALIKRLVELRMKPGEYADYLANPFRPEPGTDLARAVASAERFYELANQRSRVFLDHVRSAQRGGAQVLVVGGFHTAAMAEELRKEGTSFVVLAPRVTQGGYDELYSQGMRETISALKLR